MGELSQFYLLFVFNINHLSNEEVKATVIHFMESDPSGVGPTFETACNKVRTPHWCFTFSIGEIIT